MTYAPLFVSSMSILLNLNLLKLTLLSQFLLCSLDREQVLTVWREVESEREDQLELARRVR
jgi:hypothetical protein